MTALSRLLSGVFGPELRQWRDAERAGRTLEQHLTAGASLPSAEYPAAADPAGSADPVGPVGPEPSRPALLRPANAPRPRSPLVRIALIAVEAIALVAAGAAGALWWTSRSAVVQPHRAP